MVSSFSWLNVTTDVWSPIFDMACWGPNVTLERHPVLIGTAPNGPMNQYESDMWITEPSLNVLISMRTRFRISQVCRTWREMYLPKAYLSIVCSTQVESLTRLSRLLSEQLLNTRITGGSLVKHLYLLQLHTSRVRKDVITAETLIQPELDIPNALSAVLHHMPGMVSCSISANGEIFCDALDMLADSPYVESLRYLTLNETAMCWTENIAKLESVATGLSVMRIGRQYDALSLTPYPSSFPSAPNLQALHLRFEEATEGLLQRLRLAFYPKLHSLSLYVEGNDRTVFEALCLFLARHSKTIELLAIRSYRVVLGASFDLRSISSHCPQLKHLIIDHSCDGLSTLQSFSSLRSVGLRLGPDWWHQMIHLSKLKSFFMLPLPDGLELIRLYELDYFLQMLSLLGSQEYAILLPVRNTFYSWLLHSAGQGITVEDRDGKLVTYDMAIQGIFVGGVQKN